MNKYILFQIVVGYCCYFVALRPRIFRSDIQNGIQKKVNRTIHFEMTTRDLKNIALT